ncbi:LIM-domain binding protein-domain-containing protein [Tuber indicum]|nr:LIM-domain binding protein-domain-containing protein [Tuber indicum]
MTTSATYSHPNQLQQHPGVQQGPQQHIQGHPGQPAHAAMQHLHPQQAQAQAAQAAAYQQQQQQFVLAGMHPQMAQIQQQLRRQQQQQQQAHLMNGMGAPGGMVFQNNGNPQVRTGMPNGMYQGGPGGIPGANMGGYGAGNPHMRGNVNIPPHVQQLHAHHQQQQQQQMAVAAQQIALNQANAANAQTPMAVPPQPPIPMQAAQQAAIAAAQARQTPKTLLGHSVLGLYRFSGHLSAFDASKESNDIDRWRRFVAEFYAPSGVMRQRLWHNNTRETKQFEVTTQVLARYYFVLFGSGVQNIQIVLENVREKELANQCHIVECPKTSFIYWFENGLHLVARGGLRATFNASSKMEELDFQVEEHSEYVPRNFGQDSPDIMKSSPGSKSLGKRPSQQGHTSENIVNNYGVPHAVLQCLEISETMSQMRDLFNYSHLNPALAPRQALQSFVSQQQQQQHAQQQHLANQHAQQQQQQQQQQQAQAAVMAATAPGLQVQQGHPGGHAGPGMLQHPGQHLGVPGGVPVGMNSPSADGMRMGVPPSPHMGGGGGPGTTPSPAQNHIQAPGLVQQHSQQAHPTSNPSSQTSTTVVSANTSPNTNKRRRASTASNVKNEGDDENGVNGAQNNKIKQSPRVGGNKRVKGNNAT